VVVSFSTGGHDGFVSVLEWSGVTGRDTGCENVSNTGTANPTVSTAISTTTNNSLLVAVSASKSAGTDTYTQPGGWTALGDEANGATNNAGASAYLVDTSAAAVKTATWSKTDGAAGSRNCIAAWKLSAGTQNALAWIRA
jgi:hypothetical protein